MISSFFPNLLYFSICEEVSSHGGLSYIDFYSFSQYRKEQFIDFYVRKMYSGQNKTDGKIENFIKNDQDLFFAKSRLPINFYQGVIFTLIYILIFLMISYFLHKGTLLIGN